VYRQCQKFVQFGLNLPRDSPHTSKCVKCAHRPFCKIVSFLALVLSVEYYCDSVRIIFCFPDLAGAGLSTVAMPSKLTQAARDDIQLQLEAGTRPDTIASSYRISERQVYKMRENLKIFGCVAPDPAQFQVQG
jgi:hypothetical protein